jgi:hypothetical protein
MPTILKICANGQQTRYFWHWYGDNMDRLRNKFEERLRRQNLRPNSQEWIIEIQDYDFQKRTMERTIKNELHKL